MDADAADRLDVMFGELLVELGVAASEADEMMQWDEQRKRQLLAMHSAGGVSAESACGLERGTPAWEVLELMGLEGAAALHDLEARLRTCTMVWLSDFIEAGGVGALFSLQRSFPLREKVRLGSVFVLAARALMNNRMGFDAVIAEPLAVRGLCLYLAMKASKPGDPPPKSEEKKAELQRLRAAVVQNQKVALELLAAVALVSEDSYQLVLDALVFVQHATSGASRFSCLVAMLRPGADADLRSAGLADDAGSGTQLQSLALSFINALISAPENLLNRVWVRAEFNALRLPDELNELHGDAKLTRQLAVFWDEQRQDEQELRILRESATAGVSPSDCWEVLDKYVNAETSPTTGYFVSLLQSLLVFQREGPTAERKWSFAEQLTSAALNPLAASSPEKFVAELALAFAGDSPDCLLESAAGLLSEIRLQNGQLETEDQHMLWLIEQLDISDTMQRQIKFEAETAKALELERDLVQVLKNTAREQQGSDVPPFSAHFEALVLGYHQQLAQLRRHIAAVESGKTAELPAFKATRLSGAAFGLEFPAPTAATYYLPAGTKLVSAGSAGTSHGPGQPPAAGGPLPPPLVGAPPPTLIPRGGGPPPPPPPGT